MKVFKRKRFLVLTLCFVSFLFVTANQARAQVMEYVGNYSAYSNTLGFCISGSYAYVGVMDVGLKVIDISDPKTPVEVGGCSLSVHPWTVALSGNYAYIAGSRMQIVDITNPSNPVVVSTYTNPWGFARFKISGNYLYLVGGMYSGNSIGLATLDLANPISPALIYQNTSFRDMLSIDVAGDYAYVGNYGGVSIFNISTPSNPVLVGHCIIPRNAFDVAVSGNYLYVAGERGGMQIINVSDPANPTMVSSYPTPDEAECIAVSGNYAYISGAENGAFLYIMDISDPAQPIRLGEFIGWEQIMDIFVGNNGFFYTTPYNLFRVCRFDTSCNFLLGDINGDSKRIGSDITYGLRYFKGIGSPPPESCFIYSTNSYFYTTADINGDCSFNGSDITRLVAYFKGTSALTTCSNWIQP